MQGQHDGNNGVGSRLSRPSQRPCKLAQLPERHERCTRILCLAPSLAALRGLARGFGALRCTTQSENLHDLLRGPRCRRNPVAAYCPAAVGRSPPVLSEGCLSARRRRCPLGCTPIRASPECAANRHVMHAVICVMRNGRLLWCCWVRIGGALLRMRHCTLPWL